MKEFNIELARNGAPVCTRCGRPARIICWDKAGDDYQIIALITEKEGEEVSMSFTIDGKYDKSLRYNGSLDLMMATTKHEGWINIYRLGETIKRLTGEIYATEEEALKHKDDYIGYITTQSIEWEE